MKLVYSEFDYQILFQENRINVLCIESQKKFREFIGELKIQMEQGQGRFVLSEDGKELELNKHLELIVNLFALDFNQKKILNRIYSHLEKYAREEDLYLETCRIQTALNSYMEQLGCGFDYPLHYSDEISISNLCKLMDLKIDMEYDSFLEQLADYMTIIHELFGCRCFVFVNLKSFLSTEELKELHRFVGYKKLFLLLLENNDTDCREAFEDYFLWDQDLCEIY